MDKKLVLMFFLMYFFSNKAVAKASYLTKKQKNASCCFVCLLCCHRQIALTHGWALSAAPGSTLSSEHGNLPLQHLYAGDELLDCCCRRWRTTARSFGDIDAVSERYLKDNKVFIERCKLALIKLVRALYRYRWRATKYSADYCFADYVNVVLFTGLHLLCDKENCKLDVLSL